jgi:Methyltransferase domain
MLTRTQKLLHHIDLAHQMGVEIGPLVNPVVTRKMGEIRYIDHVSTEALRLKYADDPSIDINQIVDVDYVWGEKSLEALTHTEAPFDYLIASHVIEHVPDLVGWLSEIRTILKRGGILSLAIPDKRQCFDCQRQNTRLCELIQAYLSQSRQPTSGQIFDYYAGTVGTAKGEITWNGQLDASAGLRNLRSLSTAWDLTEQAFASGDYCDVHCWVFTPASFLNLLADLAELGLLKFEVVQLYETAGCEFFVSLRAMEQPVARSAIHLLAEAPPQPHPTDAQQVEALKELHHQEKCHLEARIQAMEGSKFWKLRTSWFKAKRKLGLPHD